MDTDFGSERWGGLSEGAGIEQPPARRAGLQEDEGSFVGQVADLADRRTLEVRRPRREDTIHTGAGGEGRAKKAARRGRFALPTRLFSKTGEASLPSRVFSGSHL